MTDTSQPRKLFGRPTQAPKVDIKGFLDSLVESSTEVQDMRKGLDAAEREIAQLQDRVKFMQSEMNRMSRQGDIWRETANELRIQLEVVVTAAVAACDQSTAASRSVIDQAKLALAAGKEQLARQGMAMVEATAHQSVIPDEDLRKLGQMFGANARKDKEDAVQPKVD
jgi:chromosome segregation ATPase